MKQLHLDALRDIAIEYIPKARNMHSTSGRSHADVAMSLYMLAHLTLCRPTASAVELAAAQLLQHLMALRIPMDEKLTKRQVANYERWAVSSAYDLYELTEKEIPRWLPPAIVEPEDSVEDTANEIELRLPLAIKALPRPTPGTNLTTAEAARYLNRAPQTLRAWASKGTGPVSPISQGRFNGWPADEIIKLIDTGWSKSKTSKART